MADPQAETPVRGRLVDELREVGKEVCTRAADVLDNVAWDRHPGHPDVPVLQPRYDSLKAELKAAEARNEALLQALKEFLWLVDEKEWAGCDARIYQQAEALVKGK